MRIPKQWKPGAVLSKTLSDGHTYYARLLSFPWAAFYDWRSKVAEDDLAAIVRRPVRFTLAAQKDLVKVWKLIAVVPLDGTLEPPAEQFIHNEDVDPDDWQIIDRDGNIRPSTAKECKHLEEAAVYEPEHIEERLLASTPKRGRRR